MGVTFEIPRTLEVGLISLDNKDLSQISLSLKRVGLNNVKVFSSLEEAVEFARKTPQALIFVDVRSRSDHGLERLKDIKTDNETTNFPLIPVVKAGDQAALLPILREYGVSEVVTMPLQTTNLLQSISRTLAGYLPGEAEGQIRAARAAVASGQYAKAGIVLQKLSDRRRSIRTELGLSHVSLAQNDLERSMQFLSKARGLDPGGFGVQLAVLRHQLQERQHLSSLEETVQEMLPHIGVPGRASQILRAFYRAGAHAEGFSLSITFENEFAADPNFKIWQAKLALKCQRLDAAFQLLQKYHTSGQRTFESLNMLGVISKKKRNYDAALKAFTEAQKMSPQDYRIYFNLGMTYEELGDGVRAVENYERALELSPTFEKAETRLRTLRPRQAAG